jgi:hypothetical protein
MIDKQRYNLSRIKTWGQVCATKADECVSILYPLGLVGDGGRPSGAAIQVEASTHRKLLWAKAMVVSVTEKVRRRFHQVSAMETNKTEPLKKYRNMQTSSKPGGTC